MLLEQTRSAGQGLERSCQSDGSWIASARPSGGVELFRAWFAGKAYDTHRHDTYAVGLTDSGVQMFDYRGAGRASTAGQVVVLHPDEPHDGRAGTREGFGYRIVYVEPVLLGEEQKQEEHAAQLARAVREAFAGPLQSLAIDSLVVDLAEGLTEGERGGALAGRRVDVRAVERARQLLDAECTRVVRSSELESITGLTRHDLARQFRIVLGTSPHRYLLMRRLDFARERMRRKDRLAEIAADAGFADQAHFTRAFKAAVGLTPARYRALCYTTSSVRAVVSPKRPSAKCGRPA